MYSSQQPRDWMHLKHSVRLSYSSSPLTLAEGSDIICRFMRGLWQHYTKVPSGRVAVESLSRSSELRLAVIQVDSASSSIAFPLGVVIFPENRVHE